ncbi:MAG: hypothetical protein COW18_10070 [Zetaproteobacteria bacterium CG12_big_fil_rev_8_21_14_0_65_54_13]|nr:MAG: hypothetical protein COW18_10070 [Zetaproteobacteria bacterium CG12_big_fil_rev_8_21_14_0_65_54_13]PIX55873.1 MAG: hypothetical protein COZ50_00380 [Zetaproteobacteria bacterium CG_4_10_14_3_um_filter_54_28]PJA28727.1 MAG: hypothetical protein CO188_08455 [Zetaproteobacteria bacterium CG_4_9_14_3_um_filter_54_145]
MPELSVGVVQERLSLAFDQSDPSLSLKDLLDAHAVAVASECGGVGKCGFCLVVVESGRCSPLTSVERATLSDEEITEGYRLACQARPLGNVALIVVEQ